ncbi:MAG: phytanoyl-CoA dioxygenase family protein [Gammaproteobacteria bacterium]|nr:phytanoyl-CoA dioxygenase family protein [Gammaproteobacteria bacterium]MBU1442495.1 phytanoyl-CoA dioxygenase family protein [Gammaproteobacteria bacterium]
MDAFDVGFYRRQGHLTVNSVFRPEEMDAVVRDIEAWGTSFLESLPIEQRAWYIDGGVSARTVLRKLDNPHAHRDAVRSLARDRRLLDLVETLIGPGVSVYFSQIFFKPPEGGGPKPAHQDNFYFGPADPEGMVTAWIALDDATLENGCLYFGEGTNLGPVYEHFAPEGEPYNLQIPEAILERQPMSPAPVRKGGVSFHHGNTFHNSASNHSQKWRRACALHFVSNANAFVNPALPYDHSLKLQVS